MVLKVYKAEHVLRNEDNFQCKEPLNY